MLNSNERAINFIKKTGLKKIGNHDFQIGKENFEFIAMKKKKTQWLTMAKIYAQPLQQHFYSLIFFLKVVFPSYFFIFY